MLDNIYKIKNKVCFFPKEFPEGIAFTTLGTLENALQNKEITEISFENTHWIDIFPLLHLGLLIGNALQNSNHSITINLGIYEKAQLTPHASFVIFFVNEGFLDFFDKLDRTSIFFKFNNEIKDVTYIKKSVIHYSSRIKTCFPPDCMPISKLFSKKNYSLNITSYIEKIIDNIESTVGFTAYGGGIAKERTLDKIRPVIQELVHNIYEHAYTKPQTEIEKKGFFSIFVRMITPEIDQDIERQKKDQLNIPLIDQISRNAGFPRIEIYVLDGGKGLSEYAKRLSKNKITGIVESLGTNLLKGDTHSYRAKRNKPYIAGLQHIGNVLMHERDYIRLFTADGMLSVCCGEHESQKARNPKTITFGKTLGKIQSLEEKLYNISTKSQQIPPNGTCYCISIPIYRDSIEFHTPWYTPSIEEKNNLFDLISRRKNHENFSQKNNVVFFDSYFKQFDIDYPDTQIIKKLGLYATRDVSDILIIRLPRHVSKDICTRWLKVITDEKFAFRSVIFSDVSPFFAHQLYNIIKCKPVSSEKHMNIRILTTAWNTISLLSSPGNVKFTENDEENLHGSFYKKDINKAFYFLKKLIEHDSKIFWGKITKNFYYNGHVEVENNIFVEGYLHFKEAISDKMRRAICKLALTRILHLLPIKKLISIEPLANSITQEISLMLKDYFQQDGKTIAIVSVNATSITYEQYETEYDTKADAFVACLQAPLLDSMSQSQHIVTALDWLPNETITRQSAKQKRIKKTPYILPAGKESIELPHHAPASGFQKTTYGCLKNETYKQYAQLGCLRFQHTKNGSRHDLLSLNTVRAIESSIFNISGPYSWLKNIFNTLDTPNPLIVFYPSHYANNIILDYVLPERAMRVGVSFFSDKSSIPLRLSPSSASNIAEACTNETCLKIIFDDGIITGKHLSFLIDYIQFKHLIPRDKILTLSLVDRSRTPIDYDVVKKKSKNDLRYWRHDVPVFSEEHSCIFCYALEKLQATSSSVPFKIKEIVELEWLPSWEVKDIYAEWGVNGLSPASIEITSKNYVIFGKDILSGNNYLHPYNSTNLLSYITEITQLLPGIVSGNEKGLDFFDSSPKIAIELIGGQFFLSFYELTPKEKEKSLKLLFKAVESISQEKDGNELQKYVSLAALCFLAVEKNIFNSIWADTISNHINTSTTEWGDQLKAFISVLYFYKNDKYYFSNSHTVYKNLIETGMLPQLTLNVENLLSYIGVRAGKFHSTDIHKSINLLQTIIRKNTQTVCAMLIERIFNEIQEFTKKLENAGRYFEKREKRLNVLIDKIKNALGKRFAIKSSSQTNQCSWNTKYECLSTPCKKAQILPQPHKQLELFSDMSKTYNEAAEFVFNNFIFRLSKGENKAKFLNTLIQECANEISETTTEPGHPVSSWEQDYYVITPDEIIDHIKNIIKNTRNFEEKIINPHCPRYENKECTFYWNALIEQIDNKDFLNISFHNKANNNPEPTFSSKETYCLKEHGGTFSSDYDDTTKIYTATIKLRAFQS